MKRLLKLIGIVLVLGLATPAAAQTIDRYTLSRYAPGAPAPQTTFSFLASATVCGAPITGPNVNPNKIAFTNPAVPTQDCVFTDTGTGPLLSIPIGNYEATLRAEDTVGGTVSAESARVPFSLRPAPGTPAGLRLLRFP